jgi:predicted nuclease of predicted toxin-antitoxin system
MRVLLDECLPKKLKRDIEADIAQTVPEAGWASKKNGELLRLAATNFDVLLTNDQNMEHQQNLKKFDLAFVVLVAPTNDRTRRRLHMTVKKIQ